MGISTHTHTHSHMHTHTYHTLQFSSVPSRSLQRPPLPSLHLEERSARFFNSPLISQESHEHFQMSKTSLFICGTGSVKSPFPTWPEGSVHPGTQSTWRRLGRNNIPSEWKELLYLKIFFFGRIPTHKTFLATGSHTGSEVLIIVCGKGAGCPLSQMSILR